MNSLSGLQRDVLYTVPWGSYKRQDEIADEVDEYYQPKTPPASVDDALDVLVEQNLVREREEVDFESYRLARRGRREIASRFEWETSNSGVYPAGGPAKSAMWH